MAKQQRGRVTESLPLPSPAWVIHRPFYTVNRVKDDKSECWVVKVSCSDGRDAWFATETPLDRWLRELINTPATGKYVEVGHWHEGEWHGAIVVAWPLSFKSRQHGDVPVNDPVPDAVPLNPVEDAAALRKGVWK